jgi:hypothetical protein
MRFRSLFVKDSPDLPEGNLTGRSGGSPLKINPWQPSGVALLQDWVVDLWRPSATLGPDPNTPIGVEQSSGAHSNGW